VRITYSVEKEPLGTAGGVKNVAWFLDGSFFIWYGDNLSTCRLDRLWQFHRAKGGIATIALHYREDPMQSGIVSLDEDDRIVRFLEKPQPKQVFSHWVSAGIFVLEPEVLEAIPTEGAPDFGRDVFPTLLAAGKPLYRYQMSSWTQVLFTPSSPGMQPRTLATIQPFPSVGCLLPLPMGSSKCH